MRFLRALLGRSRFEAAMAEDFEREAAARAEVKREIYAHVRRAEAAARLMVRLQKDL